MVKCLALLIMFLPKLLFAGTTETVLQSIFDDYQTQCVAAQADFRHIDYEEDDPVIADLSLPDDSIYEIIITADGQTACADQLGEVGPIAATIIMAGLPCREVGVPSRMITFPLGALPCSWQDRF